MSVQHTPTEDETDEEDAQTANSDAIRGEVVEKVEEAADRLEAAGEPLTVGRLAGTTLQLGIDTDANRLTTIAEASRQAIDERANTEIKTEVVR